jgi:acetoacetyl-CoA synthetase
MTDTIPRPGPIWRPTPAFAQSTELARFMRWLEEGRSLRFADYSALWQWSIDEQSAFWGALWEYLEIDSDQAPDAVLTHPQMPGAEWFPGARINFARHVLWHRTRGAAPAIIARSEARPDHEVSWEALAAHTARLAARLRSLGVAPGDRVAAYLPNVPEAVVAFLACASIGAVWTLCAPDVGPASVIVRFRLVEPVLLIAVDGYRYGGRDFDRRDAVAEIAAALPTVRHVARVPLLPAASGQGRFPPGPSWADLLDGPALPFEPLPVAFDHPLWIVYSSGTSGAPKGILHGHGGVVLDHAKAIRFHLNMRPGDRLCRFTSTGWIVWNLLVGGLLAGCTIVCLDGHPNHPEPLAPWRWIDELGVKHFGCGAAFLTAAMRSGVSPREQFAFPQLESIGVTGSPLTSEGFNWVYGHVKEDLWLISTSGGTDVAGSFVGGCPLLPVRPGELQHRLLGIAAYAFDESGQTVVDEVGELVITRPMPSMPLRLWGDHDGSRYLSSYFDMYPGVWRHGDWIRFYSDGASVIYGRSDATINRHGIRMGTAEIYAALEDLPEVADCLVVDLEYLGRVSFMPLFVQLAPGCSLSSTLEDDIRHRIRTRVSARHVPDALVPAPAIPRTLNGKRMEVPVRRILLGSRPEDVASPDAMQNPDSLAFFAHYRSMLPS